MRMAFVLKWGTSPDTTWYLSYNGNWTLAEIASAIVCGCLPAMPRVMGHLKSKIASILSSHRRSRTADPRETQEKVLEKLRIKRTRSSGDKLELRDRNNKESEQHSLEPKKSVHRPDCDTESADSLV
ncbi:MAG: hypothetical protein Q9214_000783 [Letrouitia sp. 1 TL-2023]